MHCDTSTRPVFDLRVYGPRAVHTEIVRFVRGIRGPRQNPVTRAQIGKWLHRTPADVVDAVLIELVAEGKIASGFNSLRHGNTARRAVVYEAPPRETH